MGFELQIKKGLKGLFAGGFGSKNLSMKPCGTLAKKVSNFRTIEAIGGVIMFGGIIGPILLKRFQKHNQWNISISSVQHSGWRVILMSIAEVGIKKQSGWNADSSQ